MAVVRVGGGVGVGVDSRAESVVAVDATLDASDVVESMDRASEDEGCFDAPDPSLPDA